MTRRHLLYCARQASLIAERYVLGRPDREILTADAIGGLEV